MELKGNQISDLGASYLGKALAHNGRLKKLTLSYNQIGTKGSIDLAKGVAINSGLKVLDLSSNQIGTAGTEHWFTLALRKNKTLKELILSQNHIGNEGIGNVISAFIPTVVAIAMSNDYESQSVGNTEEINTTQFSTWR